MKTSKLYTLFIGLFFFLTASGNDLEISNVTPSEDNTSITFDISWDNSWRQTERFHDAVWVFIKYKPDNSSNWEHAYISSGTAGGNLEILPQSDSMGIFIRNAADYTGDVTSTTITAEISLIDEIAVYPDFKVFGLEMVYVPEGGYYFGDGMDHSRHLNIEFENSYYTGPFSTSYIMPINDTSNYLFLGAPDIEIEDNFPNGYHAFYSMKYPFTQELVVEHMNQLSAELQERYTSYLLFDENKYQGYSFHYGLYSLFSPDTLMKYGRYKFYNNFMDDDLLNQTDDGHNLAVNFKLFGSLSVDPAGREESINLFLNMLNWSGLRPMSEMEYEKAARGPLKPVPGEYAWGDAIFKPLDIIGNDEDWVNRGQPDEYYQKTGEPGIFPVRTASLYYVTRVGMAATYGTDRVSSHASYYGISDMTGNGIPLLVSIEASGLPGFSRHRHGDGSNFLFDPAMLSWDKLCSRLAVSEVLDLSDETVYYNVAGDHFNTLFKGRGVRTP